MSVAQFLDTVADVHTRLEHAVSSAERGFSEKLGRLAAQLPGGRSNTADLRRQLSKVRRSVNLLLMEERVAVRDMAAALGLPLASMPPMIQHTSARPSQAANFHSRRRASSVPATPTRTPDRHTRLASPPPPDTDRSTMETPAPVSRRVFSPAPRHARSTQGSAPSSKPFTSPATPRTPAMERRVLASALSVYEGKLRSMMAPGHRIPTLVLTRDDLLPGADLPAAAKLHHDIKTLRVKLAGMGTDDPPPALPSRAAPGGGTPGVAWPPVAQRDASTTAASGAAPSVSAPATDSGATDDTAAPTADVTSAPQAVPPAQPPAAPLPPPPQNALSTILDAAREIRALVALPPTSRPPGATPSAAPVNAAAVSVAPGTTPAPPPTTAPAAFGATAQASSEWDTQRTHDRSCQTPAAAAADDTGGAQAATAAPPVSSAAGPGASATPRPPAAQALPRPTSTGLPPRSPGRLGGGATAAQGGSSSHGVPVAMRAGRRRVPPPLAAASRPPRGAAPPQVGEAGVPGGSSGTATLSAVPKGRLPPRRLNMPTPDGGDASPASPPLSPTPAQGSPRLRVPPHTPDDPKSPTVVVRRKSMLGGGFRQPSKLRSPTGWPAPVPATSPSLVGSDGRSGMAAHNWAPPDASTASPTSPSGVDEVDVTASLSSAHAAVLAARADADDLAHAPTVTPPRAGARRRSSAAGVFSDPVSPIDRSHATVTVTPHGDTPPPDPDASLVYLEGFPSFVFSPSRSGRQAGVAGTGSGSGSQGHEASAVAVLG